MHLSTNKLRTILTIVLAVIALAWSCWLIVELTGNQQAEPEATVPAKRDGGAAATAEPAAEEVSKPRRLPYTFRIITKARSWI